MPTQASPINQWPICESFRKDVASKILAMGAREGGRTLRRGVFLPSMCLLDSPFLEPLLRTLLRTLSPFKSHCETPSKNPSAKNLLESSLENLLRTLLRSVLSHDPLGVRPTLPCFTPNQNPQASRMILKTQTSMESRQGNTFLSSERFLLPAQKGDTLRRGIGFVFWCQHLTISPLSRLKEWGLWSVTKSSQALWNKWLWTVHPLIEGVDLQPLN